MKTINEPDMWCEKCGNHELEVSGSEQLPIYTCTKCKNMMWQADRSGIIIEGQSYEKLKEQNAILIEALKELKDEACTIYALDLIVEALKKVGVEG